MTIKELTEKVDGLQARVGQLEARNKDLEMIVARLCETDYHNGLLMGHLHLVFNLLSGIFEESTGSIASYYVSTKTHEAQADDTQWPYTIEMLQGQGVPVATAKRLAAYSARLAGLRSGSSKG